MYFKARRNHYNNLISHGLESAEFRNIPSVHNSKICMVLTYRICVLGIPSLPLVIYLICAGFPSYKFAQFLQTVYL